MTNVLKSQGKIGVLQLIENQLRRASAAVVVALALAGSTPAPLPGPARSGGPRDPRGGVRAPVCLPLPVRTSLIFGADGGRT